MSTNQKRQMRHLVTTSIGSLVILSMLATGASSAFAQDCVRDPAWLCDGDVDGDGQVNPVDSGLVQAAFGSADEQQLCNFDVDCDGQINPVDAGLVQSLFGTCEAPRDACEGPGPSLNDLILFQPGGDVVEFVTTDDHTFMAGIVVGEVNRPHTIHWSTNNENVSVDPPESEVYFEERGDVFLLTFTRFSGLDEAFTLLGEVEGPDFQGAVEQEVILLNEVPRQCLITYTITETDKDGKEVGPTTPVATSEHPVKRQEIAARRGPMRSLFARDEQYLTVVDSPGEGIAKTVTVYNCKPVACDGNGFPCAGAAFVEDLDNNGRDDGRLYCECPGG